MDRQQFQSCIDACNACADACDYCAVSCAHEQDARLMARCLALNIDCAQLCRLAAGFMTRGSELALNICQACAEVCEACAEECAKYTMDHCLECTQACRRCADECRRMVALPPGSQHSLGSGAAMAH